MIFFYICILSMSQFYSLASQFQFIYFFFRLPPLPISIPFIIPKLALFILIIFLSPYTVSDNIKFLNGIKKQKNILPRFQKKKKKHKNSFRRKRINENKITKEKCISCGGIVVLREFYSISTYFLLYIPFQFILFRIRDFSVSFKKKTKKKIFILFYFMFFFSLLSEAKIAHRRAFPYSIVSF